MKSIWYAIQAAFVSIGGFVVWFLGGIDGYVYVLVVFIVVDYITGVMRSVVERRLSSHICARGIFKKILIFILIGLSNLVDRYLLVDLGVLRVVVTLFYISNEGISILENAHSLGLPIPSKLSKALLRLREKGETKDK